MYKIWIIFEREYLQRVKKKSFLIGTLLTPLIFPLFIGITIFFLSSDDEKKRIISCLDYNSLIHHILESWCVDHLIYYTR